MCKTRSGLLKIGLLLTALVLAPSWLVLAQEDPLPILDIAPALRFSHLTTKDGLSNSVVTAIVQDRQGLMWIGTEDGLNRYDGYEFTIFRTDPNDPNSLSDNSVYDLHEDSSGMLWVATDGAGVNRFDPHTETFTRYRHEPGPSANSLGGDAIRSIFEDSRGYLWFGGLLVEGQPQLTRFDPVTETFTPYLMEGVHPEVAERNAVWDMIEDPDGNLWLAADLVLAKFDPETEEFIYYRPESDERRLRTLYLDESGVLWIAGSEGLYQFDPQTAVFSLHQADPPIMVNDILANDDGTMWVSTEGKGLHLFDPLTGQFRRHYRRDTKDTASLSNDRLTDLYRDRAGVLWIASDKGLNLYDPGQRQFAYYRSERENEQNLVDGTVWGMAGEDGRPGSGGDLWLGSGETLNRFDLTSGDVTRYPLNSTESDPRMLPSGALYYDPAGFVWVGNGPRLIRLDESSGEIQSFDLKTAFPPGSPPLEISALVRDGAALLVAAGTGGLFRFDQQNETFEPYLDPPPELEGTADPRFCLHDQISTIYGDHDGAIWLGYSTGGISRFDPDTATFRHYVPDPGDPHSIPEAWIASMVQDRDGVLWLASRRGLIRFDPRAETFHTYTEKDGLSSAYTAAIQQDQSGALWLATSGGLSRFDPQNETFRNYDADDGVGNTEFSGASWQSADGLLFFGVDAGLIAFYPDRIVDSAYQPPIILTALYLFHEPVAIGPDSVLQQPIWETEHLTLEHDQTSISFEFAALSYAAAHKNRYRYILEGVEKEWNEVDSAHRLATYTHLPAGKYVFRVQGSNEAGIWSDEEVALTITILPPWWETWWFRGGTLILVIGLAVAGIRWRLSALQQRSRLLEAQVAERTEELKERSLFLQMVIDSLTHPFYVINAHDRTVEMTNTAAYRGHLPEGSTCHALIHQGDQPCEEAGYPCPLQEVKRTKQPVVVEHVHVGEEGNRRDVEIHGFPILDQEGNVVQMIEYALDISERKQAQERVHQAEVRLAALEERERIGRELHDDLGQVIGYLNVQAQAAQVRLEQDQVAQAQVILTQLAQAAQEAQGDVRQYILGIRTSRMAGIRTEGAAGIRTEGATGIRTEGPAGDRTEGPAGDPRPARLAGGSFVAALSQYLRVLRLRYGLETRISLPDDPLDGAMSPQVETQLLRIIREALTNVAKHAGVERAWVVLTLHADEVQVVVEDDGCGFDLDQATAASESPSREHFGLAIMRERAEAVGGSAEMHSAPDQGTRIVVRLPRVLAPSAEDVLGRGVRVLLVDDHPLYLEGLRTLLVSRGLDVVGDAHDGLEALDRARALRPDLILMDVQMPGCDGLEATRRIKAEMPEIKIVMLTMAAEGDLLFEALKSGAAGYLLKSLDSSQFFSLLSEVMAGRTALSPSLANRVLTEFARHDVTPPAEEAADAQLTPRQQEVLELVAQDMSNQEIARSLYISENTVKYHVSQILERLQVNNRHKLAPYARQQDFVLPAGGETGSRNSEPT